VDFSSRCIVKSSRLRASYSRLFIYRKRAITMDAIHQRSTKDPRSREMIRPSPSVNPVDRITRRSRATKFDRGNRVEIHESGSPSGLGYPDGRDLSGTELVTLARSHQPFGHQ